MHLNKIATTISSISYQNIVKPILFQIDPEKVHESMTSLGEKLGRSTIASQVISKCLNCNIPQLQQSINGINFSSPLGLSAGFDYNGNLTQITPHIGFGFHTIGTITRSAYVGNPRPILGRLPKSRSLMVNKGFKNNGVEEIVKRLSTLNQKIPVGISIGRTNSTNLQTHIQCINDIISTFIICESSKSTHSYYELNISCPNLLTPVSFYIPHHLNNLLQQIDILNLTCPLYIKMPIECDNNLTLQLLEIISKHNVQGVIFGNLQKNRLDPSLDYREVDKFPKGNFSGKPTQRRSDELIALSYKHFKDKLIIIGTGGIFSASDAYTKIKLGASLVQLITGMVFLGPQLPAEIKLELLELLKKDGLTHINEAIGVENQ